MNVFESDVNIVVMIIQSIEPDINELQSCSMWKIFQAGIILHIQHVKSFLMQMMLTLADSCYWAVKPLYAPHNDKHEIGQ